MRDFILYIIQSGIFLSFFGIVYFIFLRKQTFFKFNRAFLVLGLLISFVLPSIQFSYDVVIAAVPLLDVQNVVTENLQGGVVGISMWQVLASIYLLGIVILFVRNLRVFWNLYRLKQSGIISTANRYRLIDSEKIETPFSILNNVFINTSKLQDKEKEIILKHEISHIDQKHWVDLLCSECALLLQWFNPMMWYYIHLLKENHEYLADQAVLNDGESVVVYRAVLINQRFQGPVFSFANSFNYSNQQNRLNMMNKTRTSTWKKFGVLAVLPLLGAFFALSAKPNYVMEPLEVKSESDSLVVVGYVGGESPTLKVIGGEAFKEGERPLIVVNGEEKGIGMEEIDSELIESIEVFKGDEAIEKYGKKAKNGAMKVTLKSGKNILPEKKDPLKITSLDLSGENAAIILDGKEVTNKDLQKIDPKDLDNVSILNSEADIKEYGYEGKKIVMIMNTKKSVQESFSKEEIENMAK